MTHRTKHGYTVAPASVFAALAVVIEFERARIQAEIDELPGEYADRQASIQAQYEAAVERERQRKIEWDAQPYHFGHEWRPANIYKPTFTPYPGPPKKLTDARDRPPWAFWIEYDLTVFSGEILTDSQKQIWRKAIREMDAAGLIERDGRRWLRLTEAGAEFLQAATDSEP